MNTEFKKMVLFLDAGYAGMTTVGFLEVPVSISQEALDNCAWEWAVEYAEGYGVYPESSRPEDDEDDEDNNNYTDDMSGYFEEYDADKHDGHRVGNSISWHRIYI